MELYPSLHIGVVAIEKGTFESPSTMFADFTIVYTLIKGFNLLYNTKNSILWVIYLYTVKWSYSSIRPIDGTKQILPLRARVYKGGNAQSSKAGATPSDAVKCHIQDNHWSLLLCRDAVSVFHSLSQLGCTSFWEKRRKDSATLLRSLSHKYPWERCEPPYPPGYGLNCITAILLEGWL